ncbi:MAG TPA: amino acid adenylation domain-containing protein, partial [Candidatus Bipolaricaulota bacterium]
MLPGLCGQGHKEKSMERVSTAKTEGWSHQQAIHARCIHPSGAFVEFQKAWVESSISALFQAQVLRSPRQVAVKTATVELTYAQLNDAANGVARALHQQNSGQAEAIALMLENPVSFLSALLGVLKAGKYYVPIDPSFPSARSVQLLEELKTKLILTEDLHADAAQATAQQMREVVNIERLPQSLPDANISITPSADALAYILFTSGSTGCPKGVVQSHRNVLHGIYKYVNFTRLCAQDRVLLHSMMFAGGLRAALCTLLVGGTLFPFDVRRNGLRNAVNWSIQEGITVWHLPVSVLRRIMDQMSGEEDLTQLRLIYTGGEPVYKRDVELYRVRLPSSCILVNSMGTTETETAVRYLIDKDTHLPGDYVPVGYAAEDTEVLLLDEHGKALGVEQTGEIAIKGRYFSPGYWNDPELTRARFLPASDERDVRMYLSGDVGLMLPDGCLIHLGRKDFQVKIGGNRIELGEVENALLSLEEVREAVVVARADSSGDQRLVAYVVPAGNAAFSIGKLQERLRKRLPDVMIPSSFVVMDALPLNAHGKVDRGALPEPPPQRPTLDTA